VRWCISHRFDKEALPLADRHYNRQKIGSPQFVPPGRCVVLKSGHPVDALWVTSWPKYAQHQWTGAWINTLFRKEGPGEASEFILEAIAATRSRWEPPELGLVTFVNPKFVKPVHRRGEAIYGYCYLKAGFSHVGYTGKGLWVWQMLPGAMPEPKEPLLADSVAVNKAILPILPSILL
jgi:hypothetical protein